MLTQLASCTDMAGQLVDMISDVTRHAVPATSQADHAHAHSEDQGNGQSESQEGKPIS